MEAIGVAGWIHDCLARLGILLDVFRMFRRDELTEPIEADGSLFNGLLHHYFREGLEQHGTLLTVERASFLHFIQEFLMCHFVLDLLPGH